MFRDTGPPRQRLVSVPTTGGSKLFSVGGKASAYLNPEAGHPSLPKGKSGSRLCRYVAAEGCRLFACLRKASVFIERGVEKNGDKSSRSRYKVQPGGHSSYSTRSTWGGWTTPSMRLEISVFESGCGDLNLVPVPTVVVPIRAAIC